MATCSACGAQNPAGKHFCTSCGAVLPTPNQGTDISKSYDPSQFEKLGDDMFSGFGKARQKTSERKQETAASSPKAAAEPADAAPTRADAPATRSDVLKQVAKAGSKAIIKSVSLSILVLGPGFLMLLAGMPIPGMIWLFCGSFGLMAWTYRKPWRLGLISCLMPPAAAAICYAIQLFLFGEASPPTLLLAGAIGAGIVIGYWRAQTHVVKKSDDGGIIAERTIQYLIVWVAAYGITQFLAMTMAGTFEVRAGLITGAFSTAMLAMVSIVIWRRFRMVASAVTGVAIGLVLGGMILADATTGPAYADTRSKLLTAFGEDLVPDELIHMLPAGFEPAGRGIITGAIGNGSRVNFSFTNRHNGSLFRIGMTLFKAPPGQTPEQHVASLPIRDTANFIRSQTPLHCSGADARIHVSQSSNDPVVGGAVIAYTRRHSLYIQPIWGRGKNLSRKHVRDIAQAACSTVVQNLPDHGTATTVSPTVVPARPSEDSRPSKVDNTRIDQPQTPPSRPQEPSVVSPEDAATAAAAIAIVLIAAGIAVNVAQAIAAALAQALQAGVQLTSEEIQAAITDALLNRDSAPPEPKAEPESNAPPNVQMTERVRPPKPIYDPNGNPFETNEKGQYLVPEKGTDNLIWANKEEAMRAAADLRAERAAREAEQAHHDREAAKDRQDSRARNEAEREQAQRQATAQQAADDAQETQRQSLLTGILSTINGMPPDARSAALMEELASAHESGELWRAQALWDEVRGERQRQLEEHARRAAEWARRAGIANFGGQLAGLTRDLAKAEAALITAFAAGTVGVVPAALFGAIALVPTGAAEGGVQYDPKTDSVKVDAHGAAKGAVRGAKTAFTSAMGGVTPANNIQRGVRGVVTATLDGAEAYGDAYADAYDREMSKSGDPAKAAAAAEKAAAEKGRDGFLLSGANTIIGEGLDARAASRQQGLTGTALGRDQLLTEASKTAQGILVGTAQNTRLKDQDLPTALMGAVRGEVIGRVAQANHVRAGIGDNPLSGYSKPETEPTQAAAENTTSSRRATQPSDDGIRIVENDAGDQFDHPTIAGFDDVFRSSDPAESRPMTERDILDADPSKLDPTLRKVQDWLKSGREFPSAHGDDGVTPDAPRSPSKPSAGDELEQWMKGAQDSGKLAREDHVEIQDPNEISVSGHRGTESSAERTSRDAQQVRFPIDGLGRRLGGPISGAEDRAIHSEVSAAGGITAAIPVDFDPAVHGPKNILVDIPEHLPAWKGGPPFKNLSGQQRAGILRRIRNAVYQGLVDGD